MRSAKQWILVNLVVLAITAGGSLLALGCGILLAAIGQCPALPWLAGLSAVLVFALPYLVAGRVLRRTK